jgi:hypothetical protein
MHEPRDKRRRDQARCAETDPEIFYLPSDRCDPIRRQRVALHARFSPSARQVRWPVAT